MPIERTAPAGLIALGFQTMSLSNSTAVALNSTCRQASVLVISVETQAARYRADGTVPALTTGVVLQKDTTYRFEGYFGNSTTVMKFQRTTGTSKVSLMAYKHAGGDR